MLKKISLIAFVSLFFFCTSCKENNKTNNVKVKQEDKEIVQSPIFKLDSFITENPKNDKLYFERAKYYYDSKILPKALVDALTAVKLKEGIADYYLLASEIYLRMNEVDEAIKLLEDGIQTTEKNEDLFLTAVEYNIFKKDYKKGIILADELLKKNRNNADAYFFKGIIFKNLDKKSKAISNFQTCVEQDPTHYNAYMQLGLLFSDNKNDLALKYFDNALKLNPKSREALYAKGFYFQQSKRFNDAKKTYAKMVKNDSKDFQAFYNIGYCFMEQDSLVSSYKHFKIASNLKVDYVDAIFMLGQVTEKMGDKSQAKIFYHSAQKLLPDNKTIKEALENIDK